MNLLLGHVLWLTGTLSISLSWEIRICYEFFWDSRYLVGIGIYFGKPKKKETFIYNSS